MGFHSPRWSASLVALAGLAAAAPLSAQAGDLDRLTWALGPSAGGWCVHFLTEPKEARKEVGGGYRVVAASEADGLHPALKRAIADEPKYADWIPTELCTFSLESITSAANRYERGDKRDAVGMMFWGIAAAEPDKPWDGLLWLRSVAANNYPLIRTMQVQGLPLEKNRMDRDSIRGNPEDQIFYTRFDGATIQFTGHFNPDTTGAPVAARKLVGTMPGPNQLKWEITFSYSPEKAGTMAGSLQVFGKRGLAKALNASPIRLIGPAFMGGSGAVDFVRSGGRSSSRDR